MLDVQIRKRLATGRKSGDSFSLDVSLSCATRRLVLFGHSGSGKTLSRWRGWSGLTADTSR